MKFNRLSSQQLIRDIEQVKHLNILEKEAIINLYSYLFYFDLELFLEERAIFEAVQINKNTVILSFQGKTNTSNPKILKTYYRIEEED